MKILMLSSEPYMPEVDPGLSIFALDWYHACLRQGHDVELKIIQKIFIVRFFRYQRSLSKLIKNLKSISFLPNFSTLSGFFYCIRGYLWYLRRQNDYDTIIAHNFIWAGLLGYFIQNKNVKLFIVEHNSNKLTKNKSMIHSWLFKKIVTRPSINLLCVSRASATLYEKILQVHPKVCGNILDPSFEGEPSGNYSKTALISVGSLDANKNQTLQLQILRILPKEYTLKIVGDGPDHAYLKQLISEYGLKDRVSLVGSKSRVQIKAIMDNSAILLNTSLSETFGVCNIEAGSRGLSIVCNDNGGVWDSTLDLGRSVIADTKNTYLWCETIKKVCDANNYDNRKNISRLYQKKFNGAAVLRGVLNQ